MTTLAPQRADDIYTAHGPCRLCSRQIVNGQWFTETYMPTNPTTDRYFTMHVKCVRAAIEDVPQDDDVWTRSFNSLRAAMLATGKVFP